MNEKPFDKMLDDLRSGLIAEIIVEANEFSLFREHWKKLPDRMSFVGEAGLNGRITYRYQK